MSQVHMQWPPKSRSRWATYVSAQYHWIPLDENPKKVVVCKHCNHQMAYNISRLRAHLIGEKVGTGKTGIANGRRNKVSDNINCRQVPRGIKDQVVRLFNEISVPVASDGMTSPENAVGSNDPTQASSSRPDHTTIPVVTLSPTQHVDPIAPAVVSTDLPTFRQEAQEPIGINVHRPYTSRSNSVASAEIQTNLPSRFQFVEHE